MYNLKKIWLRLLIITLLLGTLTCSLVVGLAAKEGKTNVNRFEFSATEVQPGQEFTVALGTDAMKLQVFTLALDFDNSLLEVIKVNTATPYLQYMGTAYDEELEEDVPAKKNFDVTAISTVDEMNASGHMGMSFVHTVDREYLAKTTLIRITFKVKAGASGATTISFYENSAGTDQCLDTKENPSGSQIVTIACPHAETTTTYEKVTGQDKHTVTVTCNACGEQVGETAEVACSGGIANCQQAATCESCGEIYGTKDMTKHTGTVSAPVDNGDGTHTSKWSCCGTVYETVAHDGKYSCDCGYIFTGWDGKLYVEQGNVLKTGWTEINDAWYYLDTTTGVRAEGLVRVPYPEFAINGVTYAANSSDKAYWEAHQDKSKYSDATTAIFVFDKNGVLDQTTGIVLDGEAVRYSVSGCVAWHVGFVQDGNDFYYFTGDKNGGGNVAATGKVYATRDHNAEKPVSGTSIYYFGEDGKLIKNEGIVKIDNVLYYFDSNNRLARGKGLTEVENGYIYVRTSGELAIGTYYTNGVKYEFDENGFTTGVKNGMVDGKIYKNGRLVYGLVECDGAIYYVRSNGELAKGAYYITDTNDMAGFAKGDKLIFGEDGKLLAAKNGIVEEGGVLYYYENNRLQCGAGVVEMTDDQGETFYIYVRSNGQLATGKYWPTILNDYLERGEYDWGENGRYYPGK